MAFGLVMGLVVMLAAGAVCPGQEGQPASAADLWTRARALLDGTLGAITPEAQGVFLRFEVLVGDASLGSGTVAFRRQGLSWLDLTARSGFCRFLHAATGSACLLQTTAGRTAFTSEAGGSVPFPILRIDPDPDRGFQLNLAMNMSIQSATHPMDLDVASGAPAYLLGRIQAKFPVLREEGGQLVFRGEATPATATPDLVIEPAASGVRLVEARFPYEAGRDVRLRLQDFTVNGEVPAPPEGWMPPIDPATAHGSAVTGLPAFIQGFYALLRELIPAS
ncbi:MAG: hypothetical protein GX442_02830 [Candidatus Riflebacteria bacterium]|nr:hypothetical protein [Candidatus Riflebacteria bacterium]